MTDDTEWFGAPVRDEVVVVDADPEWERRFEEYRGLLARALGPVARRIDHVGSTAVPGLASKPVIDVQVSVPDVADEGAYRPPIESLGWHLRARRPEHRFFRPPAGEERTIHVHVCSAGSAWERRHLLFVAYLRAHPERAGEYARLKRALAARLGSARHAYTDAKDGFIATTLVLAEHWAADTGWEP